MRNLVIVEMIKATLLYKTKEPLVALHNKEVGEELV